ncbi:predicted protein [Chaetoceros tenuissimus]|uniref:Uncharacterized protein n=1 Tax=Chaetoceros tenuissimus TaxID=426638 RepID=A0AAD3CWD7_9STRA|nr:predicted protein [Chaetoceros tenuissimus]
MKHLTELCVDHGGIFVGWFMAGGEGIGIIGMKIAEISEKGFILSRPHDLHLVNFAIALCLIAMPIGPSLLSAIGMMTTQFFNSSAKPVLGENLYRLALLVDEDPAKVFAKANMYRRIGNSIICVVSPLLYSKFASLSFYVIGGTMLFFLFILVHSSNGIKHMLEDLKAKDQSCSTKRISYDDSDQDLKFSTIGALKSIVRRMSSEKNLVELKNDEEVADKVFNKFPIASNVMVKIDENEEEDFENDSPYDCAVEKEKEKHIEEDDLEEFLPGEKGNQPSTVIEEDLDQRENGKSILLQQSMMGFDLYETVGSEALLPESKEYIDHGLLYFLLVQTFPFLDAAITRLPFVFLAVAMLMTFLLS